MGEGGEGGGGGGGEAEDEEEEKLNNAEVVREWTNVYKREKIAE